MISLAPILAKLLFLMYRAVSTSLASPAQLDLNGTEVILSEGKSKPEIISEQLVNFFNPVTCRPKENQVVEPCLAGGNMNETLCLKHGCCPSYKGHVQLKCFGPLKDQAAGWWEIGCWTGWTFWIDPTGALKTLRVCVIGAAGLFLLGCLPFCCVFVEKSPCANPLRRATKDEDSQEDSEESEESSESHDEDEAPKFQKKDPVSIYSGIALHEDHWERSHESSLLLLEDLVSGLKCGRGVFSEGMKW